MKSNKQRKAEIKAKRSKAPKPERLPPLDSVPCCISKLALSAGYYGDLPRFAQRGYYVDISYRCRDCGSAEIWTAKQQQWWYEVAKGRLDTCAVRCRACRQKKRGHDAKSQAGQIKSIQKSK
ncbi:zinc-ribbon domain containing protein [Uliginosibacterium gangwonense]|uniref:zinc-ribbon domain containing protein n=1 Tax=Uliginosibacterium gangwonense TaxID=392736 RepID=UPI0003A9095E|nr:zinc-ribbon domain containing protein [Uliginosibacterium gangwonense]